MDARQVGLKVSAAPGRPWSLPPGRDTAYVFLGVEATAEASARRVRVERNLGLPRRLERGWWDRECEVRDVAESVSSDGARGEQFLDSATGIRIRVLDGRPIDFVIVALECDVPD